MLYESMNNKVDALYRYIEDTTHEYLTKSSIANLCLSTAA
jgi:hypothetical protein